jgi:uncharacterized protein YciI
MMYGPLSRKLKNYLKMINQAIQDEPSTRQIMYNYPKCLYLDKTIPLMKTSQFSLTCLLLVFISSCVDSEPNDTHADHTIQEASYNQDELDKLRSQADSLSKIGYETFIYEEGDKNFLMQEYYMVRLLSGTFKATDSATLAELQKKHLAHLSRMYEAGHASLIGPMAEGGKWRGIVVYNTPNKEMADSLARLDPMVKAGILKVETTGWWTQKGGQLR